MPTFDKRIVLALVVGVAIAMLTGGLARTDRDVAQPVEKTARASKGPAPRQVPALRQASRESDDVAIDLEILERARGPRMVRDLFAIEAPASPKPAVIVPGLPPKPPPPLPMAAPIMIPPAADPPPAPVRTAPPLPYRYVGRWLEDGIAEKVLLARGEDGFSVAAGDTLDASYRVVEIKESEIVLLYVPMQIKQSLATP